MKRRSLTSSDPRSHVGKASPGSIDGPGAIAERLAQAVVGTNRVSPDTRAIFENRRYPSVTRPRFPDLGEEFVSP